MTLEDIRAKLAEIAGKLEGIQKLADDESRDLTGEEQEQVDQLATEFDALEAQERSRSRIASIRDRASGSSGRRTDPNVPGDDGPGDDDDADRMQSRRRPRDDDRGDDNSGRRRPRITTHDRIMDDPRGGFPTGREFIMAVYMAGQQPGRAVVDRRLARLQPNPELTVAERGGAEGGILVPPDYSPDLKELIEGELSLLARTDQWPTTSNQIVVPVDETENHPDGGGIQVYWTEELSKLTQSRPIIGDRIMRLHKATALIPVSDEHLEDSNIDLYLRRKVPKKFTGKINQAIVRGSGTRMPLGILNSPARVTVPKESGQAAATIVPQNLANMWARMYAASIPTAVWLINQDTYPQLQTLQLGDNLLFTSPTGLWSVAPWGSLFGRPIVPVESCSTLGTEGDIIFVDMEGLWAGVKTLGDEDAILDAAVSMHLWFDYNVSAFRFIIRVDVQPWLRRQIVPEQGTANRSQMVTLETRA